MRTLSIISLVLLVVGGLNWLLIGLFNFDLVASIFGVGTGFSRFIYTLVGLAGIFGIFMLGKLVSDREDVCVPGHQVGIAAR